ncbi:MAG: TIGR04255 family protein [Terriglobales bacterium]
MPIHRHYPNAPITEALIDLRVGYGQSISLETLKKFGAEIKSEYPNEATRDLFQSHITLDPSAPSARSSKSTIGYIFHSGDRKQAVQARMDGFTFSRFPPYQDWHHLVNETKRLWGLFVEVAQPTTVLRVAVRYINQINLPLNKGALRFEHYLRTFPASGLEENVELEQFLVRLVMPQKDIAARLILTEALLPPQDAYIGVILDVDLSRENVALDVRSDEIWAILESFRERKNRYFEASITDASRELFA